MPVELHYLPGHYLIKGAPTNPSSLQIVKVSLFGVVRRYS